MPKVDNDYLKARREKILKAAVVCFARKGFAATTIPDICREAGVSIGAVYRYFPGKNEIIKASIERYQEQRVRCFAEAAAKRNFQKTLDGIMPGQARSRRANESDNDIKVMLHSLGEALTNHQVRKIMRESWQEAHDRIEKTVKKAQKSGEVNAAFDAKAVAIILHAIHDGLFIQRLIVPETAPVMEKVIGVGKALFLNGASASHRGRS